jgi:predicted transcriptional regulator
MSKFAKVRRLSSFDVDTREIIDCVPVMERPKIKWGEDFVMLFQGNLDAIFNDKELSKENIRVWFYLVKIMGFENTLVIPRTKLAVDLNIDKSNISRSLSKLVKKNLLLRGEKIGRSYQYQMNSAFVWKGKIRNLKVERRTNNVSSFSEERLKRDKKTIETNCPF